MRTEELVRRTEQDVGSDRRDVDRPVRSLMDGIDPRQRTGLVGQRADPSDVVDRSNGVRRPGKRDHTRAPAELALQVGQVERAVLRIEVDEPDPDVAIDGELEPGRDVGVVVHPRDDDFVFGLEGSCRCP